MADARNIPVLAFGLRNDFRGELFEGSCHLLAWADNLEEIETIATPAARRPWWYAWTSMVVRHRGTAG